jgi:YjbE family integral membrane protein
VTVEVLDINLNGKRGKTLLGKIMDTTFLLALLAIIWIDIILSADNAILIALACRGLPENQRKWGILLGTAAAIILRIIFALIIAKIMGLPFIRIIGGVLLLWIAIKLIKGDEGDHTVKSSDKLWSAVITIAIADGVMSLDNVLAIAAVAKGDTTLMVLGVLISIPLIIFGAQLFIKIMEKYPLIIVLGAAVLGWLGGDLIVSDTMSVKGLALLNPAYIMPDENPVLGFKPIFVIETIASLIGALFVVILGKRVKR